MALISWNCRGFRNKIDDLKSLIFDNHPACIALQETFLKPSDRAKIRRYHTIRRDHESSDRASGGVALLVSLDYPFTSLSLTTELQAVAVRIQIRKVITICSVYLPPNNEINKHSLAKLIDQLPTPFIIMGDFNAHNVLWGSDQNNPRGLLIENIMSYFSLCCLNNGDNTYFHEPSRTFHALDLAFCSPSLFPIYSFWVSNSLHNSDHFPIFLSPLFRNSVPVSRPPAYIHDAADWPAFSACAHITREMVDCDIDDAVANINTAIINAANRTIPKTSCKKKYPKPWWTAECSEAKKKQQKAWNRFRRYPTTDNLMIFKRAKADARRIRRRSQKESWENFTSSINTSIPTKLIWSKAKRAMGLYREHTISCLKHSGNLISDIKSIADTFGESFASVSSSTAYSKQFLAVKLSAEKKKLNFNSSQSQPYNSIFTESELTFAMSRKKNTSPGPDGVTYDMLKHLSYPSFNNLLYLYNRIWTEHIFPSSWQKAYIIPFHKLDKDPTDPMNYRPIALTSCICKLLERMVNTRLVYVLEKLNYLHPFQSGFRKKRSTIDNIIHLETEIRNAHLNRNHLVSIFFDMEKAYDRTWRYGILRDIYDLNLRGNLPIFIKNFLSKRIFQVRIGNILSDDFIQEEGVPQGSVLSVTLFCIRINNILSKLPPCVKGSLFVDDLRVSCQAKDMRFIDRQLQISVRQIETWTEINGFKISYDKTACVHFCKRRGIHPEPEIYLGPTKIRVVESFKYLGVIFDKKLTFAPHISHLRIKCEKALNLLRVLSKTSWGADRTSMLRIYRATIRSKMDYACAVYGSARHSILKKLDTVHHSALRICSGAFRTSPIPSLYVECVEPSLHTIRAQSSITQYFNILSHTSHPLRSIILDGRFDRLYQHRPSCIPSFGQRMRALLHNTNLENASVFQQNPFNHPPWNPQTISYLNPFNNFTKPATDPKIYNQLFLHHRDEYSDFTAIYTDGSKSSDHVGCAVYCNNVTHSYRLQNSISIFTAEILAIREAIKFISNQSNRRFIIYSDSRSVLDSLCSPHHNHPFIVDVLHRTQNLLHSGYNIIFCWIPGHVGIKGNDLADAAAKSASNPLSVDIPFIDIKKEIKKLFKLKWQEEWDRQTLNKLHKIKPYIHEWPVLNNRKYDVYITRLRIGHTFMTHRHLLLGETAPICPLCQSRLTVSHILTNCPGLRHAYLRFFRTSHPALENIIGEIPHRELFNFLKCIGVAA